MEILKLLLNFISTVIWPITILVIIYWIRIPLIELIRRYKESNPQIGRNLRLKLGQFEVESNIQERLKDTLEKRLQMAKTPILAKTAMQEIDKKSMEALNNMYKRRLNNATLINWYEPIDGIEPEIYSKLLKLELIQCAPMYDGDEIAWITPVGLTVLEKVNQAK